MCYFENITFKSIIQDFALAAKLLWGEWLVNHDLKQLHMGLFQLQLTIYFMTNIIQSVLESDSVNNINIQFL